MNRRERNINRREKKEKDPNATWQTLLKNIFNPIKGSTSAKNIIGLILFFIGGYFLISFFSFLFTGIQDQSIVMNHTIDEVSSSDAIANPTGRLGAFSMQSFVNEWIGLPILFIIIYIVILGGRLAGFTRIRVIKPLFFTIVTTIWFSLALTLVFKSYDSTIFFRPGGRFGEYLYDFLLLNFGTVGLVLITILSLIIILLVFIQPVKKAYLSWVKKRQTPSDDRHDHQVQDAKHSLIGKVLSVFKDDKSNENEEAEVPIVDEVNVDEDTPELNGDGEESSTSTTSSLSDHEDKPSNHQVEVSHDAQPLSKPAPTVSTMPSDGDDDMGITVIDNRSDEDEADTPQSRAAALVKEHGRFDPKLDLGHYQMPSIELLKSYVTGDQPIDEEEIRQNKEQIIDTLRNFGIGITSITATVGPTITLYEIVPDSGVRISRIRNLEDDIALSLSALGIRIIAPIPGKGTIGIEVPNKNPKIVSMRSVIGSKKFQESKHDLPVALGRTITNEVFTFDLAKMPHLLVAGATGQGKSVGLNAIIASLLYMKHPAELKFVMVDPKMVEFSIYAAIEKHYLAKLPEENQSIITDTKRVVTTLNSLCQEMDDRYTLLTKAKVRNMKEYNEKFQNRLLNPEKGHRYMPYIVVIIDEYGDLIMTAGKEIEMPIARLAQKARAVGIHAIIATQRPTTSIITGTIKANFPGRIAFRVFSQIDSRTILDAPGANRLVGKGDLLYSQGNDFERVQCAFIDTPEVNAIAEYISHQPGYSHAYDLPEISSGDGALGGDDLSVDMNDRDPLFEQVAQYFVLEQQASVSLIQRKYSVGYNRAGRVMDQLEAAGIVGAADGSKPRKVLIMNEDQLNTLLSSL